MSSDFNRPFELAISTSLFCWGKYPWPGGLLQNLRLIEQAGIHWIELWYNSCPDHFDYTDPVGTAVIKDALEKAAIRVWSGHIRHHPVAEHGIDHIDEGHRQLAVKKAVVQIKHLLELGGHVAILHPGGFSWEAQLEEERINKVLSSVREMQVEIGESPDFVMALENLNFGEDFHKISSMKKLMDRISDRRVGICLDTGHANLQGDVTAAIRTLGSKIFSWHVSDNDGKNDMHAVPFSGTINWPDLLATACETGYRGPLVLELYKDENPEDILLQINRMRNKLLCR